jgi:DNA-binding MarR family transcriptional regulator
MKSSAVRTSASAEAAPRTGAEFQLLDHVGHLLRRAHQRHNALFQEAAGNLQLTPTQFAALVKISQLGEVSQNQLGRLTAMDPATIQGVIQRLEVRQLIERKADPTDRRCTLLSLSTAGAAMMSEATTCAHRVHEALLASLPAGERQILMALLRKLI